MKIGDENPSGNPSGVVSNRQHSSAAAETAWAIEGSTAATSKRPGAFWIRTGVAAPATQAEKNAVRTTAIRPDDLSAETGRCDARRKGRPSLSAMMPLRVRNTPPRMDRMTHGIFKLSTFPSTETLASFIQAVLTSSGTADVSKNWWRA